MSALQSVILDMFQAGIQARPEREPALCALLTYCLADGM